LHLSQSWWLHWPRFRTFGLLATMGAAATLMEPSAADLAEGEEEEEFDFDAVISAESREAEASADLQKVVDYLLDSHLERVATLGAAVHRFREAKGLPPGAVMPSTELIPYLKADRLVNLVLDVPARIEEDGALTTLSQVLDSVTDPDVTWSKLVQHLKSVSNAHQSHKLPVMRAVFDAIDTNGNGSVDRSELLAAMKKDQRVAHFMGLPCQVKAGEDVDESAATVSFLEVFTAISKGAGEGAEEKEIDWDAFKAFVLWK
jgi:hypothetical protein